jgi:hypothetical protein
MSDPTTDQSGPSQPVDHYLDEMFDRLAGTGAAGRRALVETEDHLRAAVADGVAAGLSQQRAEADAISRFGPAAVIARQLRGAHRRHVALSALSGAWLIAGLGAAGLGTTYLLAALNAAVQPRPAPVPFCQEVRPDGAVMPCPGSGSLARSAALAGLVVVVIGAAILIGRAVSGRHTTLPGASRRFPVFAAGLFTAIGLVLLTFPPTDRFFLEYQGPGLRIDFIGVLVAALTALCLGAWGVLRARRQRPGSRRIVTVH